MYDGLRVLGRVVGWAATFYKITEFAGRYFLLDLGEGQAMVVLKEFLPSERRIATLIEIPSFDIRVCDLHGKLFVFEEQLLLSCGSSMFRVALDEGSKRVQLEPYDSLKPGDYYNFRVMG